MYTVERTRPFIVALSEIAKGHPKIEEDLAWLEGRLQQAPDKIGDHVQGIKAPIPVYKTRCKDSCCRLAASGGWRAYYAVSSKKKVVYLFLILHKKVSENAGPKYIGQMIERAFA